MTEHPKPWGVIERARNGDPAALAELYEEHAHLVHSVAFHLTASAQDADDVLQDVFVGLPEALRSYDGRGSLRRWLRAIAMRRALMALREERRRRQVPLATLRYTGPIGVPEPVVEKVALERAMARLPEALRAVFVLREIQGCSHEEIGEMLGIGAAGSALRLHRARKALREILRSSA